MVPSIIAHALDRQGVVVLVGSILFAVVSLSTLLHLMLLDNLHKRLGWVPALVLCVTIAHAASPELDDARAWLRRHPPSGTNAALRRQHMAVIQKASDSFSIEKWNAYTAAWAADPSLADRMEKEEPILSYLSRATTAAIQEIRQTRVEKGVVAWHLYNMGYVFKTPQGCFGIDLSFRAAPQLADDLDFLLVTHEHQDHQCDPLLQAMTAKGKPFSRNLSREVSALPPERELKAPLSFVSAPSELRSI